MRKKLSLKNAVASIIQNSIAIIIGLVAQALFIKFLNIEYLGLNGLFNNIISMLGIVELGIGNAIVYKLYRPIAENDIETIKSLMNFYKKTYNIISAFVLIIGLIITPFLGYIVGEININVNIYIVFILFILDTCASYLLSYKRSILYANQRNYIVNYIHILYIILLNIFQIIVLYFTKNYYIYLIIKIVMRLFENIIITLISNKMYIYLTNKDVLPLNENILSDIKKKIKALFFHQIGSFIVNGTDNILISKFFSIIYVGLYSNYYLIINSVTTLFGQLIDAVTPSVGNMLITESKDKNFDVFKKIRFINFWVSCWTSTCILVLMNDFVNVWLGEQYILSYSVLIVLVINFYQQMMKKSYSSFKNAAGIFYEDRFVPLVESVLNIVASIILLKLFGLAGVFMGTIISGLALWCYSYPKFVYHDLLGGTYFKYIEETIGYFITFILIAGITFTASIYISISNLYVSLIVKACICILLPNLLMLIVFNKSNNYKYLIDIIKKYKK